MPKVAMRIIHEPQMMSGNRVIVRAGEPGKEKKAVWIVARQHPGEAMAEWFMEGFLDELTDPHNAFSARALKHAVFYVVPNINPDGAIRGHLRTNAAGANLNREWAEPSMEHSPEVGHLRLLEPPYHEHAF